MSFEALQERLSALQETTSQLKDLIDRLGNLKFQPGSVPLSSSSEDNVASELSTEINQILREEEEDLELLSEEIVDLRSGRPGSEAEHAKARLKDGATRLEKELKTLRVSFRKAQLSARHSLESAQRLERSILLASYSQAVSSTATSAPSSGASSPTPQHNQLFPPSYRPGRRGQKSSAPTDEKENLIDASSSVTAALRRTHDIIYSELSRSQFAQQTLAESTAALESLQQNYAGLDDMLRSSRDLLGTLLTSNKSDTWYLETAFYMLVGTLGWLVFRRWIYGPAWWLVWMPLRMIWGTGKGAVGLVGGAGGKVEVEAGDVRAAGGEKVAGFERGSVPVPTVRTGKETRAAGEGDPNSMVEQVGRMVDEIGQQMGDGKGQEQAGDQEGVQLGQENPKKRMWEENKEAAKEAERVRDEL